MKRISSLSRGSCCGLVVLCLSLVACDDDASSPGDDTVLRTEYVDSEVVTTVTADGARQTTLFDADGEVGLVAELHSDGEGTIRVGDSDPQPFSGQVSANLENLHDSYHELWASIRDQPAPVEGVSFATTCYVGEDPQIQVSCGLVCDYPSPYDTYGRGPATGGLYSEAECHAYAAGCGNKNVLLYYPYYNSSFGYRTYCLWSD